MIYYKKFDSSLYQSRDFKSRFSKLFVSNSETEVSKVILICKFISNLIALLISQTLFAYLPTLYQKFSINFIVIHKNYTIIHHELLWCHYKYPLLKEKNNFPYTSCPIFIMKKKKEDKRSGWKNRISDHQPNNKTNTDRFPTQDLYHFLGKYIVVRSTQASMCTPFSPVRWKGMTQKYEIYEANPRWCARTDLPCRSTA